MIGKMSRLGPVQARMGITEKGRVWIARASVPGFAFRGFAAWARLYNWQKTRRKGDGE